MDIGIIGQGFVGTALKEAFSPYCKIRTYDKFRNDLSTHKGIASCCGGCEIVFVCVPTPMNPDGSCDISIVEDVCMNLAHTPPHPTRGTIIVIKSTIPPMTTNAIREKLIATEGCGRRGEGYYSVVFNPEFLIERTATEDFKNTNRVILGGPSVATKILREFYLKVFPKADIIETDSTTAEFIKYAANCFLATKVSLANEFAEMCSKLGISYDKVVEYATKDERLGSTHWSVPGPDGKRGFGGSCFPKDLNALIHVAQSLGVDANVLEAVWKTNLQARPERDWESLKGRAVN